MVQLVSQEVAHPSPHNVAPEHHVSVGKEEHVPARRQRPAPAGVVLPEPSRGQLVDANHLKTVVRRAQPIRDRAGAVVGTVVDEDDLVVGIVEGEQRRERLFRPELLVSSGHDHRHPGKRRIAVAAFPALFEAQDVPVAVEGDEGHGHPTGQCDGGGYEHDGDGAAARWRSEQMIGGSISVGRLCSRAMARHLEFCKAISSDSLIDWLF